MIGIIVKISQPAGNLQNREDIGLGAPVLSGGEWERAALEWVHDPEDLYRTTREPIQIAYEWLRVGDLLPGEDKIKRKHRNPQPTSLPQPGTISLVHEQP